MKTHAFRAAAIAALTLTARPLLADGVITVGNSADLEAALTATNAGRTIQVLAGDYTVSHPLTVPDRATLIGAGLMLFDGGGLPTGFAAGTRTTLRAAASLIGDILTLGDGSAVQGIAIEDVEDDVRTQWDHQGNLVVVSSRGQNSSVSASITACELVNPNDSNVVEPWLDSSIIPSGPSGRGLLVITRNNNVGADPPPDSGSHVSARMTGSIIRSFKDSPGLFAINFAPRGNVSVVLEGNVIGGGIDANGGVPRPDAVFDSVTDIQSRGNRYQSDVTNSGAFGWYIHGGSTAPFPLTTGMPGSTGNRLRMVSFDDVIQGYLYGIVALGAERFLPPQFADAPSNNRLDLELHRTQMHSHAGDFLLLGAYSDDSPDAPFPAGDGNLLRALFNGVVGTGGQMNNYYTDGLSFIAGSNNRLQFVGNPNSFAATNQSIDPAPPAGEFTGGPPLPVLP
jgi:hypothetical protein